MQRILFRTAVLAAVAATLAVPAAAFQATIGNVNIIAPPPSSGTIEISNPGLVVIGGGLVPVMPPLPAPTAPVFVLEGSVFNKRSGQPVEGAVIVQAFPAGHPPFPTPAPGGFALTIASDQNGLYSTLGDGTQFTGIMIHCVYARGRSGRIATAAARLPRVYTPYLRRDVYLDLPPRVTECHTLATLQFLSGASQP